jgi:hypothetical protein
MSLNADDTPQATIKPVERLGADQRHGSVDRRHRSLAAEERGVARRNTLALSTGSCDSARRSCGCRHRSRSAAMSCCTTRNRRQLDSAGGDVVDEVGRARMARLSVLDRALLRLERVGRRMGFDHVAALRQHERKAESVDDVPAPDTPMSRSN